ncbi:MAG: hemerythrin family protein [Holophagaceae bacterium]|uniref:Hemerythrin family protein n=1 Tax=Candidatus Geothrix skivensis TaxID=2954439 RepID=A0A9D7SEC6_9BACT|nr:hemerythrin family protein [Candidatus Geothrix skivensis]
MTERTASPTWQSRYATNIPSLDAHHQGLFKILRMLVESTQKEPAKDDVDATLSFLEEYTRVHFESEEALMARCRFPGAGAHAGEHARFSHLLRRMKERLNQGDDRIPGELVPTLSAWLRDHILQQDMALAEHLRTHHPA